MFAILTAEHHVYILYILEYIEECMLYLQECFARKIVWQKKNSENTQNLPKVHFYFRNVFSSFFLLQTIKADEKKCFHFMYRCIICIEIEIPIYYKGSMWVSVGISIVFPF